MGRSRYKIYEPTHPHFMTCTVLHWISIFTKIETTEIIFNSLRYLQKTDNFKLYAYVILENHLHLIASSDDIAQSMRRFKAHTAKEILKLLEQNNVRTILNQLAFYKKAHKTQTVYQFWQEGTQPKHISSEKMMLEKINYIHQNPVKRGYVDDARHWRYSSARDYKDEVGLIDVEKLF